MWGRSRPIGEIGGRNILVLATCSVSGFEQVGLLAPQGVFQSADGVLHFALELIGFAFAFELAVAGHLSNNFLHFALGLPGRALDAIFVHHNGLQYFERSANIGGPSRDTTKISDHYYTASTWPSRLRCFAGPSGVI